MTDLKFKPLHNDFGARVTGLDASKPMTARILTKVQSAIDEYSFLCFPNQNMDDDRHLAFTKQLGEPEENHVALGESGTVTYFGTIGNVQQDGSKLGNDHKKTKFLTGNYMWHTDSSFRPVPAKLSIMCAYEVPVKGGATEFVSLRSAYRRLEEGAQERIKPLVAIHDYVYSRSKVGADAVSPSLAASLPPVPQKLVRANPANGRKNYYLGAHAKTIEGWNEGEARILLDDLQEFATKPKHTYSHAWQPGEVVIWDNRCLLHRGAGYNADKYRRYMRTTRIRGDCPTLEE